MAALFGLLDGSRDGRFYAVIKGKNRQDIIPGLVHFGDGPRQGLTHVFGQQIQNGTPEYALYGFAVFYFVCLLLNWWFYMRPNAYVKNP